MTKLKIIPFTLVSIFAISAFGQKSKHLFGTTDDSTIRRHLEEVNRKNADSTYLFSATPASRQEIQERNEAPQHFPYPIIFVHGLEHVEFFEKV